MAFKVEIACSESVKPSSPTPDHRRTHNLTLLDQISPAVYVPLCLFFPGRRASSYDQDSFAESLKDSLSNTLNVYYPFAGRYKDTFSIDCNDAGVDFVRARVACHMSDALQQQAVDEDRLLPLLPCRPQGRRVDSDGKLVLLAVQVSFFECGGVSVGVCAWHGLSDACTLSCFLGTWSRFAMKVIAHGDGNDVVVRDCTDVFPLRDLSVVSEYMDRSQVVMATPGTRIKRFVFGRDEVAGLRRDIKAASRVQAVSAVIWAAAIRIARDKNVVDGGGGCHLAAMAVNLRPRMKPALPEQVMGSLAKLPVLAAWPVEMNEDENDDGCYYYGAVAGKLRESLEMVTDENMRNAVLGRSEFWDALRYSVEKYAGGNVLTISSWCRFPFYEVDFGLGKPAWMCFFTMCYNLVVLLDAEDGVGVEAWVTLSEEDMSKFEKDVGVLKYATCSKKSWGGGGRLLESELN